MLFFFCHLRYRALVYDPAKDRVARYFEWVRWCKRKVWHMGDDAPAIVKPGAPYFPSFSSSFEVRLAKALLKSTVLPDSLGAINVHTWYNLLGKLTHDESNIAVTSLVSRSERILRALFRLFEQIAGPEFAYSRQEILTSSLLLPVTISTGPTTVTPVFSSCAVTHPVLSHNLADSNCVSCLAVSHRICHITIPTGWRLSSCTSMTCLKAGELCFLTLMKRIGLITLLRTKPWRISAPRG